MDGEILSKLTGGDRRSIGKADQVAAEVAANPSLFGNLFLGLTADDPVVRMRAADAIEKITRKQPGLIARYKNDLLKLAAEAAQQEVRWHLAQIVPRLELDDQERIQAAEIFFKYLSDPSKIVQVNALQALVDFAEGDYRLRPDVSAVLREMLNSDSPAVRKRAEKLSKRLY